MGSPAKVKAGESCIKISLAFEANAKVPSENKAEDLRNFFLLIFDFIMLLVFEFDAYQRYPYMPINKSKKLKYLVNSHLYAYKSIH
jgi:hypothetical protein